MSLASTVGIAFMRLLSRVPLPLLRGFGSFMGKLLFRLARSRRHVVLTNLALCFPGKTESERQRLARLTFVFVAQSWLDRAWLWHAPKSVVQRRLRMVGAASEIDEIATGTTPLILFAPHFYGLDAAATALTLHTTRHSTTIYTTQRDPQIDDWVREGRQRFGNVEALGRVAGIRPVLANLRKGGLLYLLPDMDFGRDQTVFVPFYGVQAATVPSLSRFARLGHARVVPVVSRLTRTGYSIEVLPAWTDFPSNDAVADTALMNRRLEQYIDSMPEQYYWVHRRFKTRPEGEAPVY